jgi:hypothetical protein
VKVGALPPVPAFDDAETAIINMSPAWTVYDTVTVVAVTLAPFACVPRTNAMATAHQTSERITVTSSQSE